MLLFTEEVTAKCLFCY
uniref:Uncharacterized protein n=1 Tax=Arundo donax TaxID=35708 RepID=A0A0A9C461_ARUDO